MNSSGRQYCLSYIKVHDLCYFFLDLFLNRWFIIEEWFIAMQTTTIKAYRILEENFISFR